MDAEEQISQGLLAPSQEFLASVKVFPLIHYLKKDVIVSCVFAFKHVL
jgi:hypothetical protein